MRYRVMSVDDYSALIELWVRSEGVQLREADSREGIARYLARNPGLSFVAEDAGTIIATLMAGHDGKRGYIQHLAVDSAYRRQGIATQLVRLCLAALKKEGVLKSHLMVLDTNALAKQFWCSQGWVERKDVALHSYINGVSQST